MITGSLRYRSPGQHVLKKERRIPTFSFLSPTGVTIFIRSSYPFAHALGGLESRQAAAGQVFENVWYFFYDNIMIDRASSSRMTLARLAGAGGEPWLELSRFPSFHSFLFPFSSPTRVHRHHCHPHHHHHHHSSYRLHNELRRTVPWALRPPLVFWVMVLLLRFLRMPRPTVCWIFSSFSLLLLLPPPIDADFV